MNMTRLATLTTALVIAAFAIPAAAQDPDYCGLTPDDLCELQISAVQLGHGLAEGEVPVFRVRIKDGRVAPPGDLLFQVWWMATPSGQTGFQRESRYTTITAGNSERQLTPAVIPDDNMASTCNRLVAGLEEIAKGNSKQYRRAPYVKGQGYDYVIYADNDGGVQAPSCS